MMKTAEKPYQKVLRMEALLRFGPRLTIDELSQKMGLDARSVFRYMERVSATGRPIKAGIRNGRVKEYWIPQESVGVPTDLIASLLRMDQSMTQSGVRKYHKIIQQAIEQLDPRKNQTAPANTEPEPCFHLDHGPFAEYSDTDSMTSQTMDRLMQAIQNRNPIRLQYQHLEQGQRKLQTCLFEPYFLSLRVGKLYLIGIQPEVSKRQLVSLVYRRIKMVTVDKSSQFERDSRVNLGDFYRHCFGQWIPRGNAKKLDIILKVDESWLMDLFHESRFNPQASIETTGKGGTVRLSLYDTPDLETWLFSLHPHAQVLQPKALRERLRARAKAALQLLA